MEEMARHVRQISNPGIIVLCTQCYICMFSYLESQSNDDDCRREVLSFKPYTYTCVGDCSTSTECDSEGT